MPRSMKISLPETMKPFVDHQDRLEALLLEGLESGNPVEVTPAYWDALRQDLAVRRKARNQR